MTQLTDIPSQILDANGNPIVAAKRWWFESETTTKKTIYADAEMTTPVVNPQISDSEGRYDSVYGDGTYKALQESNDGTSDTVPNGTEIWTQDPTNQSPVLQFSDYDATRTYSIGDIVWSIPYYYISITDSNSGNSPVSSAANWSRLPQVVIWNINETYFQYDSVYVNGNIYTSKQNSNVGNNPATDTANTWWEPGIRPENIDVSRLDQASMDPATMNLTNFIATQAEQEAGTETGAYVSPSNQQYHPSAVKKWFQMDGTGTPSFNGNLGFSTITDNATGDFTLNFDGNMGNTTYAFTGSIGREIGNGGCGLHSGDTPATGSFTVGAFDTSSGALDPPYIFGMIIGDLA